jgi:hypothetical protein
VFFNESDRFADAAEDFFCRVPASDFDVIIPNPITIGERFRRPNRRSASSGHITWSFSG